MFNDSYADVILAGQPLRIGGTMGHGFAFGRTEEEFAASPEYKFLKEFENTDLPKVCLAHMPDTFIFNGAYSMWNIDLVLSGHTHGGLIRMPFVGGLYAPMPGMAPEIRQRKLPIGRQYADDHHRRNGGTRHNTTGEQPAGNCSD